MPPRVVGVAVLGLGTIGAEVVRTIQSQRDLIEAASGYRLELRKVLERGPERATRAGISPDLIVADFEKILKDNEIDVVVGTLGGDQPAAEYLQRSLEAGMHVVTANKEALAKHLRRLVEVAHQHQRALLFEASVGGGIPLMTSYRQILLVNRVDKIRGIVNGTTNYMLWQMAEQGWGYDQALAEAQRLGYAEPDPTNDVVGFDATYKLAILASMMLGRHVLPDIIDRTGITNVSAEQIAQAKAQGATIKLIASAIRDGNDAKLRVAPEMIANDELLAHINANFNAVELTGDRVGPVLLSGQGAGPLPTASAIVSDIVEAMRDGKSATIPLLE